MAYQNFRLSLERALQLILALCIVGAISACGRGDADEPVSPAPASFGNTSSASSAPSPRISTNGVTVLPGSIGIAETPVVNAFTPGITTPNPATCDINRINDGRLAGTGLIATGIDTSGECPYCPSAEMCITSTGDCLCLDIQVRGLVQ